MPDSTVPAFVNRYDPGDLVRLVATFVSTDGLTTADPSSMTFYVRDPHMLPASVATYPFGVAAASVVRLATGVYARDHTIPFEASAVGTWYYAGRGTGGVQAAETWAFIVERTFIL